MSVITNFQVYDLEETIISSGYAMIEEYNEQYCLEQINTLKEALASDNRHCTTVSIIRNIVSWSGDDVRC